MYNLIKIIWRRTNHHNICTTIYGIYIYIYTRYVFHKSFMEYNINKKVLCHAIFTDFSFGPTFTLQFNTLRLRYNFAIIYIQADIQTWRFDLFLKN